MRLHKSRLFNATDSSVIALGQTCRTLFTGAGFDVLTHSNGSAYFTITTSKAIQIEHRCGSTNNTTGFGQACGFGDDEIYSEIRIWKQ